MSKRVGDCTCRELECNKCPFNNDAQVHNCLYFRSEKTLFEGLEMVKKRLSPKQYEKALARLNKPYEEGNKEHE